MQSSLPLVADCKACLNKEHRLLATGLASQKIKTEMFEIFGVSCISIYVVSKATASLFFKQPNHYFELHFDSKIKSHELEFVANQLVTNHCAAHARFPFSTNSKEVPSIRVDTSLAAVLKALSDCRKPKVTLVA